jgi:hypothetical protein
MLPANFALLFVFPLGSGCWTMYGCLFEVFGRLCLRLNSEQMTLAWELFTWKYYRLRPSPRQSIDKLVYIPKYFSGIPTLCIWSGEQKYQFSMTKKYSLFKSEAELEWLAHELSDWLDLPITNPMGNQP